MEENKTMEHTGLHNFSLDSFSRAKQKMIATNDNAYSNKWDISRSRLAQIRNYSLEEITKIIQSGSLSE